MFTGDTRDPRRCTASAGSTLIVTDAPYGVVHGSARRDAPSARSNKTGRGRRDRSAADLLAEAIPVWARQLRPGGAFGLSWNTYGLRRDAVADLARSAGLGAAGG